VWGSGCDTVDCHGIVCDITRDFEMSPPTCQRLDCGDSPQCRLDCQMGRMCPDVDCKGTDSCFVNCGPSASCDVDCTGAASCAENCQAGSQCLLCCGSSMCPMAICPAPVDFGGGVYVCGRDCP